MNVVTAIEVKCVTMVSGGPQLSESDDVIFR
jgi:hypothetical protein